MNNRRCTFIALGFALLVSTAAFAQSRGIVGVIASADAPGLVAPAASSLRAVTIKTARVDTGSGNLDIVFSLRESATVIFQLLSTVGARTIVASTATYPRGEGHMSLEIGDLRPGSYLIRLSTAKGLAQERVEVFGEGRMMRAE